MTHTDTDIARAQALGRAAGAAGSRLDSCPYDRRQPVLRARWGIAYAGAAFVRLDAVDEQDQAAAEVSLVGRFGRWWNGHEDDD
jgi:ribosome modulation factor